jgi:hypothetical protein
MKTIIATVFLYIVITVPGTFAQAVAQNPLNQIISFNDIPTYEAQAQY